MLGGGRLGEGERRRRGKTGEEGGRGKEEAGRKEIGEKERHKYKMEGRGEKKKNTGVEGKGEGRLEGKRI